jgi:hypothetical protein
VHRGLTLVLHSVVVRDHTGDIMSETSFTEEERELHLHNRVVEVHEGSDAGFGVSVGRNFKDSKSSFFERDLELGGARKGKEGGNHAGEACQAALERAGEHAEIGEGT